MITAQHNDRDQPSISTSPERDEEGYLLDPGTWTPAVADLLAGQEGLTLDSPRREIIDFIRNYFEQNVRVPEARVVLRQMDALWGPERATRRYLYSLFPRGYGQQACKIAGMRKPLKLMLDV